MFSHFSGFSHAGWWFPFLPNNTLRFPIPYTQLCNCLGKYCNHWFLSPGFLVTQMIKNMLAMQETQVRSLGQEDSLEKGSGSPLRCSGLENPVDAGAWWVAVCGVAKSWTQPSDLTLSFSLFYLPSLCARSCPTLRPRGLWPTGLLCPWSFPG